MAVLMALLKTIYLTPPLVFALVLCSLVNTAQPAEANGDLSDVDAEQPMRSEEDRQFLIDSGFDPNTVSPDTIVIKPPSYTDEEQLSKEMPRIYKCDGCKILAYQLEKRFASAEKKMAGKKYLPESEMIDIVEGLCRDKFEGYGLMSAASGAKYLVGEGLDNPKLSGSLDNGSLWSQRLGRMCLEVLDVFDEDEIYDMYKSSRTSRWDGGKMCSQYCRSSKQKRNSEKTEL